jgi:hypothetical protein
VDGRIASIRIIAQPIFSDPDSVSGMLSWVYSAGNWLHSVTRETFIQRELLFRVGDCASRLPLTESERLLREYGFLGSVNVESVRRPDGDIDVTVTTRDDWSLRLEPRFNFGGGFAVSGIRVGETNLFGRGRALQLSYVLRSGQDDVILSYFDPQFLMTRWNLGVTVLRGGPGWTVAEVVAYPFLGLLGEWAAFQNALYSERWFRYVVSSSEAGSTELLLSTLQKAFGLGGALRSRAVTQGRSTRAGSYGVSLSYEDTRYSRGVLEDSIPIEAPGVVDSMGLAPSGVVQSRESLRLNLIGGLRWFDYVKRRGVSTLGAIEDIALGASADLLVGWAPNWLGMNGSYALAGLDLYGGSRVRGNFFSVVRLNGEARFDIDYDEWRDMFAAVQLTNFWIVNSRSTNEITASYSAGWRTTVPFQLTLGGAYRLGGYAPDRFPGGARAVLRVENRYRLGAVGGLFDFGSVVFADVGKMWSNGVPFGVDSGLRASLGIGLRLATPVGSRQTYRLQLGIPLERRVSLNDLVLSFSIDRLLRVESESLDPQLARSRDPAVRSTSRYLE